MSPSLVRSPLLCFVCCVVLMCGHSDAASGAKGAISSLKVGPGTEVVLYKEANYKGSTTTCSRHMSGLGDFNDKTASIKIFKSA